MDAPAAQATLLRAGSAPDTLLVHGDGGTLFPVAATWDTDADRERVLGAVRLMAVAAAAVAVSFIAEA